MEETKRSRTGPCPRCGSRDTNAIVYGYPDLSEEWPANLVAGGCLVTPDATDRSCNACAHSWQTPAEAHR